MNEELIKHFTLCFDKSPEEAVEYLKSKGIKITWDWKEQLAAIKEHAFTVAKCGSADVLEVFLEEVTKAVEEGKTYHDFKKSMNTFLTNNGYEKRDDGSAWRLDVIYRTNIQSAYMAGRYQQMKETTDEFPYWEYVSVSDNRTTDGCKNINGVILPANDNFWSTNYPPRHYRCRSRVRAISEFQMRNRNLTASDSEKFKDIQPAKGFDNIPGEFKPDIKKYSPSIRNALKGILKSYG